MYLLASVSGGILRYEYPKQEFCLVYREKCISNMLFVCLSFAVSMSQHCLRDVLWVFSILKKRA